MFSFSLIELVVSSLSGTPYLFHSGILVLSIAVSMATVALRDPGASSFQDMAVTRFSRA